MQYTVYRTVNLVNGKFYIGVHKTKNPEDDYLGSGKLIQRAIAKYGIKNFRKDILAVFDNPEEAFALEREIVDREIDLPGCYNSKGLSGYREGALKMNQALLLRYYTEPEYRRRLKDIWNSNLPSIISRCETLKAHQHKAGAIGKLEKQREARDLRERGLSIGKIAHILKVSTGSVSVWVAKVSLTEEQTRNLRSAGLLARQKSVSGS